MNGVSESEDMKATIGCLSSLGANVQREGDTVTIFCGLNPPKEVTLDCIESGSTLRFMIPVALASGAEKIIFKGAKDLLLAVSKCMKKCLRIRAFALKKAKTKSS
ncbi:MAG: hypothetical protein L6V83_03005 [Christensenella sp.]|nr:MAG: hypothetical protein L6V83_03005 [Christensenella sp.]